MRRITSMTFNESEVKRFVKMLDSFLFSNEKITSIFQWIIKMKNKLFVNANHFDTKKLKIIYILNRTDNFAAKHLNFRTREIFFFFYFFRVKTCLSLWKKCLTISIKNSRSSTNFVPYAWETKIFIFFEQNFVRIR